MKVTNKCYSDDECTIIFEGASKRLYDRHLNTILNPLKDMNKEVPCTIDRVVIADDEKRLVGNCGIEDVYMSSGWFEFSTNPDTIRRLIRDILTHEGGHSLFSKIHATDEMPEGDPDKAAEFNRLWRDLKKQKLIHLFKDSNFTPDAEGGHPEDDCDELFASAYLIWKHYKSSQFRKQKDYRRATRTQKTTITAVFRYVAESIAALKVAYASD